MTTPPSASPDISPLPRHQKILAVASGKGGVGKTFFSVSLCQALAEAGNKVLLFDGDLGLANVDIQLGLMPQFDLGAVISGKLTLPEVVMPYPDGKFSIVAGRSGSGGMANLPASRLHDIKIALASLAENYDRTLIDLGAGVDRTVRGLAGQASTCIVVTTPEPTALTDAYAYIKLSMQMPSPPDVRIVVNMANTREEGEQTYKTLQKACQSFLKLSPPLLGVVRRDKKVLEAIRNQKPVLTYAPHCNAAVDIRAIVKNLIG